MKLKVVYGNMKWWDVAEDAPSFSDLPSEFNEAHSLWHLDKDRNFETVVNLLEPYLIGFFVAENLSDFRKIFDFPGIPEVQCRDVHLTGIDFMKRGAFPIVKTEAFFNVPCVDEIDDINLDSWFEARGENLFDCISFGWRISLTKMDFLLTFENNQGVESYFL